jgi:hypothetical protein
MIQMKKGQADNQSGLLGITHAPREALRTRCPAILAFDLALILALFARAPAASAADPNCRPLGVPAQPLVFEVQLDTPLKLSRLKPGGTLEGAARRDLYSGKCRLFPAASRIHLTVGSVERRREEHSDRWPWLVRFFFPRHENYPSFRSAIVSRADGTEIPMRVTLLSANRRVEVHVATKPAERAEKVNPSAAGGALLTLQAEPLAEAFVSSPAPCPPAGSRAGLVAGTQAHLMLLDRLSASKNRAGDSFEARLAEPVCSGSRVLLPEGALLQGRIAKSVPPRRLSRPGSLLLTFTSLTLPTGASSPVAASPTMMEVDQSSQIRMDSEGGVRAGSPGKARLMIDLGVSGAIAKVTDDSFQLIAEALVSTATDASTAGTSRLVAAALAGAYFIARRGRDVILPKYTPMDITFTQPPSLLLLSPQPTEARLHR